MPKFKKQMFQSGQFFSFFAKLELMGAIKMLRLLQSVLFGIQIIKTKGKRK